MARVSPFTESRLQSLYESEGFGGEKTMRSKVIRELIDEILDDRVDLDLGLIGENERVLQITLGHLLGEERLFDFRAGAAR